MDCVLMTLNDNDDMTNKDVFIYCLFIITIHNDIFETNMAKMYNKY